MKAQCRVPDCRKDAAGEHHVLCAEHLAMVPRDIIHEICRAQGMIRSSRKPNMVQAAIRKRLAAMQKAVDHVTALVEKQKQQREKVEA